MVNKKGFDELNLAIWFLIILIIFCIIVIISSFNNYNDKEIQCKEDCKSYNALFVEYEYGYKRNEECWCRKGDMPLRIW